MNNVGQMSGIAFAVCNVEELLSDGKTPYERTLWRTFQWVKHVFRIETRVSSGFFKRLGEDSVGMNVLLDIFMSYVFNARGNYEEDIFVADVGKLQENEASETQVRRLNDKEVLVPDMETFLLLPWEQIVQLTGEEKVVKSETSDHFRQDPEYGEEYCSDLQGETDDSDLAKQTKRTIWLRSQKRSLEHVWRIFIDHHLFQEREKLDVPQECSFPIPLQYIDVVRQPNTALDAWQDSARIWWSVFVTSCVRCVLRFQVLVCVVEPPTTSRRNGLSVPWVSCQDPLEWRLLQTGWWAIRASTLCCAIVVVLVSSTTWNCGGCNEANIALDMWQDSQFYDIELWRWPGGIRTIHFTLFNTVPPVGCLWPARRPSPSTCGQKYGPIGRTKVSTGRKTAFGCREDEAQPCLKAERGCILRIRTTWSLITLFPKDPKYEICKRTKIAKDSMQEPHRPPHPPRRKVRTWSQPRRSPRGRIVQQSSVCIHCTKFAYPVNSKLLRKKKITRNMSHFCVPLPSPFLTPFYPPFGDSLDIDGWLRVQHCPWYLFPRCAHWGFSAPPCSVSVFSALVADTM